MAVLRSLRSIHERSSAAVAADAMKANTVIQIESPRASGVPELISALDGYLNSLYPPTSNHFLDLDQLAQPDIRLFVARREGAPLACGALRITSGYGEVKRMYVAPAARGEGLGRAILARIESEAQREGLRVMRLERAIGRPRRSRSTAAQATWSAGP